MSELNENTLGAVSGGTAADGTIPMPDVVGHTLSDAQRKLNAAGLTFEIQYVQTGKPRDTVIITDPLPGDPIPAGGKTVLKLSDVKK